VCAFGHVLQFRDQRGATGVLGVELVRQVSPKRLIDTEQASIDTEQAFQPIPLRALGGQLRAEGLYLRFPVAF
jgi:hypothetical protein